MGINFPECEHGPYGLAYLLERRFAADVIEDYRCGTCKGRSDANQNPLVHHAPPLLIVHLRRYRLDPKTFEPEKITDEVNCEADIDLGPYLAGQVPGGARYELRGFISHSPLDPQDERKMQGPPEKVSLEDGHYWAGVMEPNGSWSIMNDSQGHHNMTKQEALNWEPERYGTPYVLAFMRKQPGEVVPEAALTAASKRRSAGGAAGSSEADKEGGKASGAGEKRKRTGSGGGDTEAAESSRPVKSPRRGRSASAGRPDVAGGGTGAVRPSRRSTPARKSDDTSRPRRTLERVEDVTSPEGIGRSSLRSPGHISPPDGAGRQPEPEPEPMGAAQFAKWLKRKREAEAAEMAERERISKRRK